MDVYHFLLKELKALCLDCVKSTNWRQNCLKLKFVNLPSRLHPGRLAWNIIMEVGKMIFLSKWVICRFHVNLPGGNSNHGSTKYWPYLGWCTEASLRHQVASSESSPCVRHVLLGSWVWPKHGPKSTSARGAPQVVILSLKLPINPTLLPQQWKNMDTKNDGFGLRNDFGQNHPLLHQEHQRTLVEPCKEIRGVILLSKWVVRLQL